MSESYFLASVTRIEIHPAVYTLDELAELGEIRPEMLRYYCRLGIFGEARVKPDSDLEFHDDDLYLLRRVELFRKEHSVKPRTLRVIVELWNEIGLLRAERRFLKSS